MEFESKDGTWGVMGLDPDDPIVELIRTALDQSCRCCAEGYGQHHGRRKRARKRKR